MISRRKEPTRALQTRRDHEVDLLFDLHEAILVTAHLDQNNSGKQQIVFTVPLPRRDPVFMSMALNDYSRDYFGIVIVDSIKFLQLWRSEPNSIHRDVANGSPSTWPSDRKYELAAKGFSHGRTNPVPLADISYGVASRTLTRRKLLGLRKEVLREDVSFVGFSNGITRTIWLLTQGCPAFPIQCSLEGARELHRIAAVPGTLFHTAGELADVSRYP